MNAHRERRSRTWIVLVLAASVLAVMFVSLPVQGSMFGEENVTLVKILAEIMQAHETLKDISDTASQAAGMTHDLLVTYQRVNAGIDELRNYTTGAFLRDLETDLYNQYPGFGKLTYASRNLERWATTRTASPFTAYEAISAVVADVSEPLRDDLAAGRANIDQELILKSEAAGGFAAAHSAEQATAGFDSEMKDLHTLVAGDFSPGQAEKVQARAAVMMLAQQSHTMRLLARAVRMESVRAALEYGSRMKAKNSMSERRETTVELTREALKPPAMMQFGEAL
jgi:hypothetical protein